MDKNAMYTTIAVYQVVTMHQHCSGHFMKVNLSIMTILRFILYLHYYTHFMIQAHTAK